MAATVFSVVKIVVFTYAAFLSAYLLTWQRAMKAVYASLIPAILSLPLAFFSNLAITVPIAIFVSVSAFVLSFYLSDKNWCTSAVFVLIALNICFSNQVILAFFQSSRQSVLILFGILVLLPFLLWLGNLSIFSEDYILTKDQKEEVKFQQLYFFPGLTLLLLWQIFLLSPLITLSVYLLIFTLLIHVVVLMQLRQQVHNLQQKMEQVIDKQYQTELLNFMRIIRSQRHDFNFHIQTIYGMIENGKYEECKEYANSMMSTISSTNNLLPLFHPATSALLNTFQEAALQKGLQLEVEIHDNLQFIASSVFETNTILGNLLQNAIDELELHPEMESRTIHLLIIKRGRNNIIKVSNQCHLTPEEMSSIFQPGFTTKNSHEGLGLTNALRVAEKYDGTVYPEFDNQTVHFIARIPLQLNK